MQVELCSKNLQVPLWDITSVCGVKYKQQAHLSWGAKPIENPMSDRFQILWVLMFYFQYQEISTALLSKYPSLSHSAITTDRI